MDRVVLASDANLNYSFYAPITSIVWCHAGWSPLLLLVGDEAAWRADERLRLALDFSLAAGAAVRFVAPRDGYATATVAQVSRLFAAGAGGVGDGDYLLTSDVEMWPLGPWVGGERGRSVDRFQVYGANLCEGGGHVQFPMCYLGGAASTWREIVGAGDLDILLDGALGELAQVRAGASDEADRRARTWDFDERYFGRRIAAWSDFRDRLDRVPRFFEAHGQRRVDRFDWRFSGSLDGFADAHLPRPGFTEENWRRVRDLLGTFLPEDQLWDVEDYRAAWEAAR